MCGLSWFLVLKECNLYLWRKKKKKPPKKDFPHTHHEKCLDIKTWVCFFKNSYKVNPNMSVKLLHHCKTCLEVKGHHF